MALAVTIDGTNQVSKLIWGSLSVTKTKGARAGRTSFRLKNYLPTVSVPGVSLVIADGATTYFDGEVRAYKLTEWTPGNYFADIDGLDDAPAASTTMAPFSLSDLSATATYQQFMDWNPPLAWWRVGEASGTTADDEQNYQDGTYAGSPTLGVTGAMTTDPDDAVTLDGTSQWIEVGNKHLLGLTDYSFACWVKTSYTTNNQLIYTERRADGTGPLLQFYMSTAGRPILSLKNDSGVLNTFSTTTGNYADGNWHHVVFTKEGTAMSLWVDGVSTATGTLTHTQTYTGTILARIGRDASATTLYWTGSLDEIAIWNVTLDQYLVRGLYHARDIRRYKQLTMELNSDGTTINESGTVSTFDAGLAPGQKFGITSAANVVTLSDFDIQEVSVSWLNASTPLYVAKFGSAPLTLAASFP